jgi:hypothetical protein
MSGGPRIGVVLLDCGQHTFLNGEVLTTCFDARASQLSIFI